MHVRTVGEHMHCFLKGLAEPIGRAASFSEYLRVNNFLFCFMGSWSLFFRNAPKNLRGRANPVLIHPELIGGWRKNSFSKVLKVMS